MATPTFQAVGAAVSGTSGTISPAWPAHQAGDVALLLVYVGRWFAGPNDVTNERFEWSNSNGFRPLPYSPVYGGVRTDTIARSQSDSTILYGFWKRAESNAEAAPVIKVNANAAHAVIITFRGVGATGDPFVAANWSHGTTTSNPRTIPGLVTPEANTLVTLLAANSGFLNASGWSNASLSALTERLDVLSGSGDGSGLFAATGIRAAAGTVNDTSFSFAGSTYSGHMSLALSGDGRPVNPTPYINNEGELVKSTTGDITVPWPVHQVGDIGLLIVEAGTWPTGLTTPNGFVEVTNSPQRAGSSGASGATELSIYWCRATSAAMPSPVANFVGSKIRGQIITVRGCKPTGSPFNATAGNVTASATSTLSWPSLTTTKDNCLILGFGTHGFAGLQSRADNIANSNLEYPYRYFDYGSNEGMGRFSWRARKAMAGAIGNTTGSLPGTTFQARIVLALDPYEAGFDLEQGTYGDVGQPAVIARDRSIIAESGSYIITAEDTPLDLGRAYIIEAITGVYGDQGYDVQIGQSLGGNWARTPSKDQDVWVKQNPLEE